MEYLLDIDQLNTATEILAEGETVEGLIEQIEELRAVFHAKRFGNELDNDHIEDLTRKAYLLTTLVSGPQSGVPQEVRQRALGVSATIFEYLWGIEGRGSRALDFALNAVLFYSKGEYEAQASSLANKVANADSFFDEVESPVIKKCWRKLFLFLGRDFKKLLVLRSTRGEEDDWNNLAEVDEAEIWQDLIEGCENLAIQLVWGEETNWDDQFHKAIALAQSRGNTKLAWLGLTIHELAAEMLGRSIRELFKMADIPERIADAFTMDSIFELWKSHRAAFMDRGGAGLGILDEEVRSVLINVPTSAGKSLIAEIYITTFLNRNQEARSIWIVPSRALVSEVFLRLRKRFKRIGISVSTVVGGVELAPDENAFDQGARVLVITPEKLDGLLRRVSNLLTVPTLIVFDEMHKISVPGRGWFLESVIAWMLLKASIDDRIKLLFMSAVLPNVNTFEIWLGMGEERSNSVTSSWRPTRLALFSITTGNYGRSLEINLHQQSSICPIKRFIRPQTGSDQYRLPVEFIERLVNEEGTVKSILVFYYTKVDLNKFVSTLVEQCILEESDSPELRALSEKFSGIYGPDHHFTKGIRLGVGIDHGDLPIWLRGMVEEAFRNQTLRILAANQVILEGVNFPIDDMLVCSLGSLSGSAFNYRLKKQDFVNLVGRVGRALINTEGRCFIFRPWIYVRTDQELQEWQSYIDIEEIPESNSTMMVDDDELLPVLQQLTVAIENGEDDIFDGLGRWREPLERLYSVVLGVAETPDGERYDQMENLVKKTLAWQDASTDVKIGYRRFLRAVDTSIEATDVELYRLAALSGLSIASARVVKDLTGEIIAAWPDRGLQDEPDFDNIFSPDAFDQIVQLRECYRLGPVTYGTQGWRASVDHYSATSSWLRGENWNQISDVILLQHATLAPNTKVQIVASYVSQMFEYRLPWALSGVALAAKELNAPDDLQKFLDSLPSFVRFGVATTAGVEISKRVRGERSIALALTEKFEESGTESQNLHDWVFEITLAQLRDWFPNESEHNLEKLRDELHEYSARNWTLRRRGRIHTKLINVDQGAWDGMTQQFREGERLTTILQVDRQMENIPHVISILANIDGEEIVIGFLKKQYEEEILELLEWGRRISVQITERRGELVEPPTVTLSLASAVTIY
jgi:helicase